MIKFKELSLPLKIAIIGGWIVVFLYIVGFIVGFVEGLFM